MVGNNGGGLGLKEIPSGSRKMVMSLKEIVNCPEAEIYSTLKDCNMDPNEAVNRLLSQDAFHEVKSKREKKKDNKDTTEGRTRSSVGTSSRGGRSGTSRYGRGGSTQYSSSDPAASYSKPSYKKDNGSTSNPALLLSAPGTTGNTYGRPPTVSDGALGANKPSAAYTGDGILPVPQPSSGYQSAWVAAPGQMSMADIVKMGKPQNKSAGAPNASHHHGRRTSNTSTDVNPSNVVSTSWPVSVEDEWPSIEPTSAPEMTTILDPPSDSKLYDDAPVLQYDTINRHAVDDDHDAIANHVGSASVSGGKIQEENADETSLFDNDMYQNRGSYQPHNTDYHEVQDSGVSVSSMTAELQQFNIHDDRGLSEDNGPSVVIPEHLQVQTADCSHLSFGSFKVGASYSAPLASIPVKSKIGEATLEGDATAVGQSEVRSSEYYGEEPYLDVADGNIYHRAGASTVNYESPSASQQEPLKPENPEAEHENRYAYPTSSQGYTFENTQQPNVPSSQTHSGPQMQNNGTFSNVMQSYTNSLPSTLLAANINAGRESDLQYLPFPMNQSLSSKYANSASSPSGSAMPMPEGLKNSGYSSTQPTQQSLSGSNVTPGAGIPQHLAMHPYSQPTLPLGPFANMIGYPFMPPSYTYLPSAYQQAFPGNNYNQQSLAALLPHKMSAPVSSLPQSASVASGYGAFASTSALPVNFQMNQPAAAAPSGTTIGYDDVLSSQYKDNNHLMSLQQSENSAMWLQGPGSRTMSAVPANTYYGMQGQNQQALGLRQAQQPSQSYGTLGYPDYYHAQAGMSMDHHQQQQNPREASLGGSQGQPKQSQQLWQNSY